VVFSELAKCIVGRLLSFANANLAELVTQLCAVEEEHSINKHKENTSNTRTYRMTVIRIRRRKKV
jgi:hypothetical protein